jgi:hypothetical protein
MAFLNKWKIAASFKKGGSSATILAINLKQVKNKIIIKLTFFVSIDRVSRSLFEPYLIAN